VLFFSFFTNDIPGANPWKENEQSGADVEGPKKQI
jgi:hypothetical protein